MRETRRPRRRAAGGLSRERIVAAALSLLDESGLDGLTMRRLGHALGVDPMAVYYYLPSKEALLDAIVEALWRELPLPQRRGPWQAQLAALARAIHAQLRAHPQALPIVATRPNRSAPGIAALEHGAAILHEAGFAPLEAVELLSAGFSFLIGHALADVGTPPAGAGDATEQPLAELLRAPGMQRRYPIVAAALARVPDDAEDAHLASVFEAGLAAFIKGVEALAAERG